MTKESNLSPYVNSQMCFECGAACCKSMAIAYSKKKLTEDQLSVTERFKLLDTDKVEVIDEGDFILVRFNIPCRELVDGKCAIYNKGRPLMCARYPHRADDVNCIALAKKKMHLGRF